MRLQPPIKPLPPREIQRHKLREEMRAKKQPYCYRHEVTHIQVHCDSCIKNFLGIDLRKKKLSPLA